MKLWHRDTEALDAAVDRHPAGRRLEDRKPDEPKACPVIDIWTREVIG